MVNQAPKRGVHRKRRERTPWPGMMRQQDGSQHPWVVGPYWDLIVTMVVPEPAEGMTRPTNTTRCSSQPSAGLPAQSGSSNGTKSGQVYLLLTVIRFLEHNQGFCRDFEFSVTQITLSSQ